MATAIKKYDVKMVRKYDTAQTFSCYEELLQKIESQGETSIQRIEKYRGKSPISIPMSYGFALI